MRLELIKTNDHFLTCGCCGFTYMPLTAATMKDCPKCLIDSDRVYLDSQQVTEETVSHDELFDGGLTYKQLGL